MTDLLDAARGRWPEILGALAGLTDRQLSDRHQPCPLCGGEDRYRFDDKDGSGSWFCNRCGGKNQTGGAGNGMDLLLRRTGWEFKDAASRIEDLLGIQKKTPRATQPPGDTQSFHTGHTLPAAPPTFGLDVTAWQYSSTFWVARFPGKKIRPVTWDGTTWQWKAPSGNRPLLLSEPLDSRPDASILIVEGEKTWDAAQLLFPTAILCTWSGGCKAIGKSTWTPLQGRKVVLWPDNDEPGQAAMDELAQLLLTLQGTSVRMVANPPDAPKGWDLADATWTPQEAAAWVKQHLTTIERDPTPPPAPEPEPIKPAKGGHFACLGFDGDAYYYQPRSTGQVIRLGAGSHNSTNLVRLAGLPYWESLYPGKKEGVNWTWAAASLFEQQAAVGVYDPDRIRGRGAWRDAGRTILHLGDRLVIDGSPLLITDPVDSAYLYQRLSRIEGPALSTPLSDQEAFIVSELAERFNWEVPASGLLLAGWVTLAPVCGALRWRPHAWLTAAAGSGKSAILDRYVSPLLADLGLTVQGNTTEAGLRQKLRADALPVVFDEAESNEKKDQERMQSVLALARVASSESQAGLFKGSAGGDAMRFSIRSMFLMASIATALKQGADRSRFAQLTLRSPNGIPREQRIAHWEALDRDLDRHISHDIGRRLQARTVALLPVILQSIRVFIRVAADHFDSQRLGDQYGTLLAGAWSLQSSQVATDVDARRLITDNDWEPYSQATEVPDEERCLQHILQHQIRVETDRGVFTRTIGELVDIANKPAAIGPIGCSLAEEVLGRHGLRVDPTDGIVSVSNTAMALATILRETAWGHGWGTVLSRLRGAIKTNPIRFKGISGAHRSVAIPLATINGDL